MREVLKIIKHVVNLIFLLIAMPVAVMLVWTWLFLVAGQMGLFGIYLVLLLGMAITTGISWITILPARKLYGFYLKIKAKKQLLEELESGYIESETMREDKRLKSPYTPKVKKKSEDEVEEEQVEDTPVGEDEVIDGDKGEA